MRTTTILVAIMIGLFFFARSYNNRGEESASMSLTEEVGQEKYEAEVQTRTDSIIGFAKGLLGSDYKEACKGPDAFDCSGFTYYVLHQFNVPVPGSSATQFTYGESISDRDIQRGDLVFFKSPTQGVDRVGHVGLVVSTDSGQVDFIHSSSYRGVVIDSLSQPSYAKRYLGARRVIEE